MWPQRQGLGILWLHVKACWSHQKPQVTRKGLSPRASGGKVALPTPWCQPRETGCGLWPLDWGHRPCRSEPPHLWSSVTQTQETRPVLSRVCPGVLGQVPQLLYSLSVSVFFSGNELIFLIFFIWYLVYDPFILPNPVCLGKYGPIR